jgi:hypothetical protein
MRMSEYLYDHEVAVLNAARTVLAGIAKRVGVQGGRPEADEWHTLIWRGEVGHAAEQAEHGIFDVLCQANASRLATLTEDQIHNRPAGTTVALVDESAAWNAEASGTQAQGGSE